MQGYSPIAQKESQAALRGALSGKSSYDLNPETTRRYLEDSLTRPAMRTYDRDIAPRIKEAFAGSGALYSSRRGQAQARALTDLQTDLTGQYASVAMQNQGLAAQLAENAQSRAMQSIPLGGQMAQQPLTAAAMMANLLNPYQNQANMQAQAQYTEFMRMQPESSPWTAMALEYLNNNQMGTYNKQLNPYARAGLGALGGAGAGFAMGGPVGAIIGGVGGAAGAFG